MKWMFEKSSGLGIVINNKPFIPDEERLF